jgi:pteridine reductase
MPSKVALVTGGAKRIGAAMAEYLAGRGFDIALHYNTSEKDAKKLQAKLSKKVRCELFHADFTKDADVEALIPAVLKKFKRLDLLVNNSAVFEKSPLAETDAPVFDIHMQVNLKAPVILTRDYSRLCKSGHIINMVDAKILKDRTSYFAYVLTKKSLTDFTKMASAELAPKFRVNAIAPGLVLAPDGMGDAYLRDLEAKTGIARGAVSDVLKAVGHIVDSGSVNGQIVLADKNLKL